MSNYTPLDSIQVEDPTRFGVNQSETSPQFESIQNNSEASTLMNTTHKSGFNLKPHNRLTNDLENASSIDPHQALNGGEANAEKKKKKKKNKNKKKKNNEGS